MVRVHAGEDAHHIVVLAVLGAPAAGRWGLGPRRARKAPPEPEPAPVPLTRATVIPVTPFEDQAGAKAWLEHTTLDPAPAVEDAVAQLNRALAAHRAAAADPYVHEVAPEQALVVRLGYGIGEEVAEGQWEEASELPRPREATLRGRRRREAALRPQERLAALLSARDSVLACEELALRARLDLDSGRQREAALQAHLALEAAVTELAAWIELTGMSDRLADLDARRDEVAAVANAALQGGIEPAQVQAAADALDRIEAALRARTAVGGF